MVLNDASTLFATPEIEVLGQRVDAHGLHKLKSHIEAIQNAVAGDIGRIAIIGKYYTYYNSFLPNLATKIRYMLLTKYMNWK